MSDPNDPSEPEAETPEPGAEDPEELRDRELAARALMQGQSPEVTELADKARKFFRRGRSN